MSDVAALIGEYILGWDLSAFENDFPVYRCIDFLWLSPISPFIK